MISYKLAKELKEAGFPQSLGGGDCYSTKGVITPTSVVFALKEILNEDFSSFYAPTLSELIDQCGEGFTELCRLGEGGEFEWYTEEFEGPLEYNRIYGSTAEESVAKLWLAIQKE